MPIRTHDGIKKRCACGKRQWSKCAHPWWFGFHFGGTEHRYSLDKVARARREPVPTSKSEAVAWRDRLRAEIRAGTFTDLDAAALVAAPDTRLTFGDVCEQYLTEHVQTPTRRLSARKAMAGQVAVFRRAAIPAAHGATVRLEEKPIEDVTKADVEAVRAWRRAELAAGRSRPGCKGGEAGINRTLTRLRHLFSWAIAAGHTTATPFKRAGVVVVKLETSVEGGRTRRLEPSMTFADGREEPGEEARLLRAAGPYLRALLLAALSTGCRVGELLSLQWSQIRRDDTGEARWLLLPATKTKTAEARVIPVGAHLRAVLSLRRHAPDGQAHPGDAYVFGDETGGQVTSIRRPWEDAVLRAHGHSPRRIRGKLAPESRAVVRAIDLHFHDVRREFASRLLESSADLHDVQLFLGHAQITTTSRYLQSTPARLERALARLEAVPGFAHHSHTAATDASATASDQTVDIVANVLN